MVRIRLLLIVLFCSILYLEVAFAIEFPLHKGMNNANVQQIQQQLMRQGLLKGEADGIYRHSTVRAVKAFQKQHQLPVTGEVDAVTWQQLTGSEPAADQPNPPALEKSNPTAPEAPAVQINPLDTPAPLAAQALMSQPELPPPAEAEQKIVTIGVLADRGVEWAHQHWGPTAAYLTQRIPAYQFKIQPLTHEELNQVAAVGSVDFILTNPAMYVKFETLYKVRPITTLKTLRLGHATMEFGSVLFCNANRTDLKSLTDLKHKRIAAVEANAFGGWLMVKRLFVEAGVAIDTLEMSYLGTHDNVVLAVRDGLADAGVVRTDTLERMSQAGQIQLTDFTLVHRNNDYGNRFPFLLSTPLYPEWPLAAMAKTPGELIEQVAIHLMSIRKADPVAKAGEYEGWTVPLNYQPVHDILKILQVEPYQDYGKVTLAGALRQYWPILALIGLIMIILILAMVYSRRMNRRLMRLNAELTDTQGQLHNELAERKHAEMLLQQASDHLKAKNGELEYSLQQVKEMQSQITKQEKMASLGRLTAGIAAEVKTPIQWIQRITESMAIQLQSLQDKLEEPNLELNESVRGFFQGKLTELQQIPKKIHDSTERIDAIMRNLLVYSSQESGPAATQALSVSSILMPNKPSAPAGVDINQLFEKQALFTLQGMKAKDSSYGNIVLEKQWKTPLPLLILNDKELSKALINLVNNACYAVHEKDKQQRAEGLEFTPTLRLSTAIEANHILLAIWDNGTGIAPEIRDKVWQPLFTTKPRGVGAGLGLPMSRDIIVKTLKGALTLHSEPGRFTEVIIRLPLPPG